MKSTQSPFLKNVLLFGRVLREAGIPVTLDQTLRFAGALEWLDLTRRDEIRIAARALLVTRREDLTLFDLLFERFWTLPGKPPPRGQKAPRAPRHDSEHERPFTIANFMAFKARHDAPEVNVVDRASTYSDQELLGTKDFAAMTPEELDTVKRLIHEMRFDMSRRRTRRLVPDNGAALIDPRRTLRQAAQYGGLVLHLPRRGRKIKQRPLVFLADISGSMEKYSRLVLQLFYSVSHSLCDVESFVFATRLSRITPQLGIRNIDRALTEAAHQVVDWSGGTRIGDCLGEFNRRFSRRVLRRGAVVVVISDGWERGDVSSLAKEMRYLRHRCHRLVWLNPLAGKETYEPRVEGMTAALPYIDDFLPIHSLESLEQFIDHLRSLPARRGAIAGPTERSSVS